MSGESDENFEGVTNFSQTKVKIKTSLFSPIMYYTSFFSISLCLLLSSVRYDFMIKIVTLFYFKKLKKSLLQYNNLK